MPNERTKTTIVVDVDEKQALRKIGVLQRAMRSVAMNARMALGVTEGGGGGGGGTGRARDAGTGRFMRQPTSPFVTGARRARGAFGMGMLSGNGMGIYSAPMNAAFRFGAGFMQQMGKNVRGNAKPWSARHMAGMGLSGLGGALGLAGGALVLGAQMAYQRRKQLADVQRIQGMARLYGDTSGVSLRGGAALGMSPSEYASQMAAFSQARGFKTSETAGLGATPSRLMRAGVSVGPMAQFASMFGPGGGGFRNPRRPGGTAVEALRQAVTQGVRGAGLDRWLQAIAAYTGQVAAQGGRVNIGSVNRLTGRMQATRGLKGLGTMQPQLMARAMGSVQGARQQVLGGLSGINEALTIQQASKIAASMPGGPTPQNMAKAFDQLMSDPNKAFAGWQGGLGELGFIGQGLSADVSRGMANLAGEPARVGRGLPSPGKLFKGARAFAETEAGLMEAAGGLDIGKILAIQLDVQKTMMTQGVAMTNLGVEAVGFLKKISDQLRKAVMK